MADKTAASNRSSATRTVSTSLRDHMVDISAIGKSKHRDNAGNGNDSGSGLDVISSVGSGAPTLGNRLRAGDEDGATLTDNVVDVCTNKDYQTNAEVDDNNGSNGDLSSLGSFAPTMTLNNSADTKRAGFSSLRNKVVGSSTAADECYDIDEVSSVGSEAPTLNTKATSKTTVTRASLKNKYIEIDMASEADRDEEDDDGMDRSNGMLSSIGSFAPTLATKQSTKTTATRAALENKNIILKLSDDKARDELSTLGSKAPTLKTKDSRAAQLKDMMTTKHQAEINKGGSVISSSGGPSVASGASFDHMVSDMALLGGVLGRDSLTSALENVVGTFLWQGALVGIIIWVVLLLGVILVTPASSYQYMNGMEQMANATLLALLVGVNMNRLGPLLVNDRNWDFMKSGAMAACCAVQFIAIASVATMLFLPTPVIIDPIVGMRCHLVRWAEWTALAFVMTFLTEGIDLPLEDAKDMQVSWSVAATMALSTVCGGILPFCPNLTCWLAVFAVSWILFCILPVRMVQKGLRLRDMSKGDTTLQKEDYERARFSFKLLVICTVLWAALAMAYSGCCLAAMYATPGSFWANDWLVLVTENVMEALSKICYLSILMEVHETLFDDVSKTARRLGELRNYMSAVWDVSSDVVVICSRHEHMINAAVSPAFFQMENAFGMTATKGNQSSSNDQVTLVMEVDPYEGSHRTFEIDLAAPLTRDQADDMIKKSRNKARMVTPTYEKNLKVLSDLVSDACTCAVPEGQKQHVLMKDFYSLDEDRNEQTIYCEAKVVLLKEKAVLIVLRDVTQRLQLYEAATQLKEEIDARKIDANANRFTRNEVKKGLSSAIELLGSLKGAVKNSESQSPEDSDDELDVAATYKDMQTLDRMLRKILASGKFGPPGL